jgi:hypothetical protein
MNPEIRADFSDGSCSRSKRTSDHCNPNRRGPLECVRVYMNGSAAKFKKAARRLDAPRRFVDTGEEWGI